MMVLIILGDVAIILGDVAEFCHLFFLNIELCF